MFKLLPGTNCRQCGQPACLAFANKLVKQEADAESCIPLGSKEYDKKREGLLKMLEAAGYGVAMA